MSAKIILSKDLETKILELYKSGEAISAISRQLNMSKSVIQRILRENNIPKHDKQQNILNMKKATKITCLKKYGTENPFQSAEVQCKVHKTLAAKPKIKKEPTKRTKLIATLDENLQKEIIEYYLAPHSERDTVNTFKLRDLYQLSKLLELHNINKHSKEVSNAIRLKSRNKTNLERYGTINIGKFGSVEHRQAILNKYGTDHIKNIFASYTCDNLLFDSFPELCIYLFAKENGWSIEREPIALQYTFNNTVHKYFPDFLINGELWEIKGKIYYDKMLLPDTIDSAKLQCIKDNNVKLILEEDYLKYTNWFKKKKLNKKDYKINKG